MELVEAKEALGNITQYCSTPPIFYDSVDVKKADGIGYRRIRVEMIGSYFRHKDKYLDALANAGHFAHESLQNLNPTKFRTLMMDRLEKRIYEKAEEESTPEYEFRALIWDFLNKCTVSVVKSHLLDGACYWNQATKEMDIRLYKLLDYLRANRDFRPIRKLTFDLKHILNAEKINGTVKNNHGIYKSCPTWRFKEDRENFIITLTPEQKKLQTKEQRNEED